jgi:hypothetical protein
MKRIHYAGREFLTGDNVADAMLEYATALARRARADRVEIPILSPDGHVSRLELVLGPASQLAAEQIEYIGVDPEADSLVDDLEHRAALLRDPRPIAATRGAASVVDGLDLPDDLLG